MADVSGEARDPHGRWTVGAGGKVEPVVDPRVTAVGGDEWNKQTAIRLENEYAAVRPDLDKLVQAAVGAPEGVKSDEDNEEGQEPDEDDEEQESVPDEWDALSNSDQEAAAEHYKDSHIDSELESEKDNWLKNDGPAEAAQLVAEDDDWKAEQLTDYLAERIKNGEDRIPYTAQQLHDAISLNFDRDNALGSSLSAMQKVDEKAKEESDKYLGITFDDDKLQEPTGGVVSKDQMTFPGIEEKNPAAALTQEMRDDISDWMRTEFWEEADKKSPEPPDYLEESAKEYVSSGWNDMSDEYKFDYVKNDMSILENYEKAESGKTKGEEALGPMQMPSKFDPMNETSGQNYKDTQRLAKYLSDHRAAQIMAQRGIVIPNPKIAQGTLSEVPPKVNPSLADIQHVDDKLWSGWKGSSTGNEGRILQVAAADELGGRLRSELKPGMSSAVNSDEYKAFVKSDVAKDGTLDEFLGALKSSSDPIGMANAVKYDPDMSYEQKQQAQIILERVGSQVLKGETVTVGDHQEFTRLPDVNILRNGAASMTLDHGVANGWSGTPLKAAQITREEAVAEANENFASIGGYEGVKAAIRAKWETTQYLLDRAEMPIVQAYRGISMAHSIAGAGKTPVLKGAAYAENVAVGEAKIADAVSADTSANSANLNPEEEAALSSKYGSPVDLHSHLADAKVNGPLSLAEAKIKIGMNLKGPDVAAVQKAYGSTENAKKLFGLEATGGVGTIIKSGQGNEPTKITNRPQVSRIVLRAELPRTAVLSVPAYGINVHSEREVVVTGGGWKGWDAWSGQSPKFSEVPMPGQTISTFADKPQTPTDLKAIDTAANEAYDWSTHTLKVNVTPEQQAGIDKWKADQDIVAKYKKTIPKSQQL